VLVGIAIGWGLSGIEIDIGTGGGDGAAGAGDIPGNTISGSATTHDSSPFASALVMALAVTVLAAVVGVDLAGLVVAF
jgi:hypothetical protein